MCRAGLRRCPGCKHPSTEQRARANARRRQTRRYRKDLIDAARRIGGDELAREVAALPAAAFASATAALGLTPEQVSEATLSGGPATHQVPDLTAFTATAARLRGVDSAVPVPPTPEPCTATTGDPRLDRITAQTARLHTDADRRAAQVLLDQPALPATLKDLNGYTFERSYNSNLDALDVVAEPFGGDREAAVRFLAGRAATGDPAANDLLDLAAITTASGARGPGNASDTTAVGDGFDRAALLGGPITPDTREDKAAFADALAGKYAAGTPPTREELADYIFRHGDVPSQVTDEPGAFHDGRIEQAAERAGVLRDLVEDGGVPVLPAFPGTVDVAQMCRDRDRPYSWPTEEDRLALAVATGRITLEECDRVADELGIDRIDPRDAEDRVRQARAEMFAGENGSRRLHGDTDGDLADRLLSCAQRGEPLSREDVSAVANGLPPADPRIAALKSASGGCYEMEVDTTAHNRDLRRAQGNHEPLPALGTVDPRFAATDADGLTAQMAAHINAGGEPVPAAEVTRLAALGGDIDAVTASMGHMEAEHVRSLFDRGVRANDRIHQPGWESEAIDIMEDAQTMLGRKTPRRSDLAASATDLDTATTQYVAAALDHQAQGRDDEAWEMFDAAERTRALREQMIDRAQPIGQRADLDGWNKVLADAGLGQAQSGPQVGRIMQKHQARREAVLAAKTPKAVLAAAGVTRHGSRQTPAETLAAATAVREAYNALSLPNTFNGRERALIAGPTVRRMPALPEDPAPSTRGDHLDLLPLDEQRDYVQKIVPNHVSGALMSTGSSAAVIAWRDDALPPEAAYLGVDRDEDDYHLGLIPQREDNGRPLTLPGDQVSADQARRVVTAAYQDVRRSLADARENADTADERPVTDGKAYDRFTAAALSRLEHIDALPDPAEQARAARAWCHQVRELVEEDEWDTLPSAYDTSGMDPLF